MPDARILRIYLEPPTLEAARAGKFGFVKRVAAAFEARGFSVRYEEETPAALIASAALEGYALFLMREPFHPRALSMRRAYYYPYWRIEASAKRWKFQVAKKSFDPSVIDTDQAQEWFVRWRRNLFRNATESAAPQGLIYVPLQGRLLDHRSFQTMSPVEMITEVQARAGNRRILLGLHPDENYTPKELAALAEIAEKDRRITLKTGGMAEALRACDLVVTENSSAALSAMFFEKPAMLFARTDFHHQMAQVAQLGVDAAWQAVEEATPEYAEYLYWFIHLNAIKADVPAAETNILETCRRFGWTV